MSKTPVLDLLRDPAHWAKGCYAYNSDGESVAPESEQAVCWCLIGAIKKCYPENIANQVDKLDALLETIAIVPFNDAPSTTHDQIVALLEKAQI